MAKSFDTRVGEEKTNGGKRFVDVVNQESCRHKEFICGHKETNLLTDLGEIRNWELRRIFQGKYFTASIFTSIYCLGRLLGGFLCAFREDGRVSQRITMKGIKEEKNSIYHQENNFLF